MPTSMGQVGQAIGLGGREMVRNHKSAMILAIAAISLLVAFVTSSQFRHGIQWTNEGVEKTFGNALYKALIPSLVCPALFFITLLALYQLGKGTPENIKRCMEDIRKKLEAIEIEKELELESWKAEAMEEGRELLQGLKGQVEENANKIAQYKEILARAQKKQEEMGPLSPSNMWQSLAESFELQKETRMLDADRKACREAADKAESMIHISEGIDQRVALLKKEIDAEFAPRINALEAQLTTLEAFAQSRVDYYQTRLGQIAPQQAG